SFNVAGDQTPKVNGVDANTKAWTTGLRYANGPINVALTYDQFKDKGGLNSFDVNGAPAGDVTAKSWNLGGTYDFEVVKLHLAGGQTRDGLFATQSYAGESFLPSFRGIDGLRVNS